MSYHPCEKVIGAVNRCGKKADGHVNGVWLCEDHSGPAIVSFLTRGPLPPDDAKCRMCGYWFTSTAVRPDICAECWENAA